MDWSTEVLTSLSSDTEPTIMVTFGNAKYMFNTSENTMRSFLQSGRVWRRTRCLFFTQARIEKLGGLPGLIMTFADATINKLQLMGPPGLNHLLSSMRHYTYRDSIALTTSEIPWATETPCYTDENVTVYAISLIPSAKEPSPEPRESLQDSPENIETFGKRKRDLSVDTPRKRVNVRSGSPPNSEQADLYRQQIIAHMFPGTNIPSPQEVAKGSRGKDDVPILSNGDIEEMRKKRAPPPRYYLQLPKFTSPFSELKAPPTMCYLLVGPQHRGKFDAVKAAELGVPKGRARGTLANGQSITFEVEVNGEKIQRTVNPEDVLSKADPRGSVLILDVPTPEHIPSLLSAFRASEFYSTFWSADASAQSPVQKDPKYVLRTIYQTCSQGVLEDERYQAFLRGFGPETDHIIASRDYIADPVSFTSVAQNQLRLSQLDSKIFPVPKYSLAPKRDMTTIPGLPKRIHPMTSNIQNHMRPWAPPAPDPSVTAIDKFHPLVNGTQPLELSSALQKYITRAQTAVSQVIASGELVPVEGSDVGIITLGTGGSLPSKYRNVLSTLVKIPGWGNIILDAGEGTWGQIARTFGLDGPENAWDVLRDLKCIFISHIHADHHIGLAQLLAKRRQLDPPANGPVYVVTIRNVHLYLRELQDVQDIGIDDPVNGIIPVLSESVHFSDQGAYATTGMWQIGGNEPWLEYHNSRKNARKMCDALGLESFQTADVVHRCRAFGAAFRHRDGWSITFSGDTAPSPSLRKIGMNSTVLIHEATMGDDESELARRKAHSTIGQAIAQGEAMNAKNVLLTHFSARYPKVPTYLATTSGLQHITPTSYTRERHVVPAFDYLNLTIGDMWKIQFYLRSMIQAINQEGGDENEGSPSPPASP